MSQPVLLDRDKMKRAHKRREIVASYLFIAPYLVLLLMFGVFPVCYALGLSFTDAIEGGFYGLNNYASAIQDFRVPRAARNVGGYVVIWVLLTIVGVTVVTLMLDAINKRAANVLRTVFFLPGAVTSSAVVVLWLFLLDPTVSPFQGLYHLFGWENRINVLSGVGFAGVFAVMAFFAHSGGWIVVLSGAVAGLPGEVIEAARIDGANRWQLATRIKVPMLWRTIVLMGILAVASGLQIFVEPQLMSLVGPSAAQPDWSINQLAYQYAFAVGDFGVSAALSTVVLAISITIALLLIFCTKFYHTN